MSFCLGKCLFLLFFQMKPILTHIPGSLSPLKGTDQRSFTVYVSTGRDRPKVFQGLSPHEGTDQRSSRSLSPLEGTDQRSSTVYVSTGRYRPSVCHSLCLHWEVQTKGLPHSLSPLHVRYRHYCIEVNTGHSVFMALLRSSKKLVIIYVYL